MITGLAHVCIGAVDLDATERFYCSGLGFKKAFEFIRKGRRIGFYLQVAGRNYVEVFEMDKGSVPDKSLIRHMCFETGDIDQVMATLKGQGYTVTDKKRGADQSWQCWTADPTGVKIEFHQYTPQSSQMTGANCVLE